ncbi:WD repeat protein [Talaromyces stipitatus ATCC 10500]|uniref:Mitochondrial division protein 1 n=1 Tax=Talaromyces stipitatus (strain ATCC 10500 / CBS 375.48 / QM 6759 / NRRL 1006) TaxID=441959 RepID=B8M1K5_TALSN|nr:WD repeat protein [Talaromyces stipitatus ATCC 10500]EED22092.1 WD repeat protein [Talaromyces stipitatus ATCC 10500]
MVRQRTDTGNPPPKRRRLNSATDDQSDRESTHNESSSSDELAATSDYELERRRASWSAKKAVPSQRKYKNQSHSPNGADSPDELSMDADGPWNRNTREQSPIKDESAESDQQTREEEPGDYTPANGDTNNIESQDAHSPEQFEQPTSEPAPPPPPPKPDRVNYVQKHLLKGHIRGVSAVRFSPDRTMIASGGADGTLKVWDTLTGKLIHSFEGHLAGISTVAWSPDNETIATGSDDKTIRLWNALTGKAHPRAFSGHHNYVYSIAFSPKGNILASGSYDEAVFLWDVRTAKVMRSLPAHSDPVAGIDVCHDGTLVVSCSSDGLIRIWDTMTGQCLRTLVHEDNPPVMAVRFSPNSKYVLAWTLDDCIRLWDYVQGRCIKTYQGHINRKYSLCGSFGTYQAPHGPSHAFAVSGSEDGALVCWDVVDKNILQRIEGHTDVVLGVDTAELNGRRLLASCGLDRTIRVWEEVTSEAGENDKWESSQTILYNGDEKMDLTTDEPMALASENVAMEAHDEAQDTG